MRDRQWRFAVDQKRRTILPFPQINTRMAGAVALWRRLYRLVTERGSIMRWITEPFLCIAARVDALAGITLGEPLPCLVRHDATVDGDEGAAGETSPPFSHGRCPMDSPALVHR